MFGLYGEDLIIGLNDQGYRTSVCLIPDGEQFKTIDTLNSSLQKFSAFGLTRSDLVIALGGGVVGDIAGFASAVYRRGIDFVQIPTTLLAMVDSSVGGKTGVNSSGGKNSIGAFHHPIAVFADIQTLKTLEKRELRAGFYELVKHGAIGGMELFEETAGFLRRHSFDDFAAMSAEGSLVKDLISLIKAQVSHKARVVKGDSDRGSNAR